MAYLSSGVIGQNLALTTAGTSTAGAGAPMTLGTRAMGNNDTVWVFVQAKSAITQYDCVLIDENFQAQSITTTLATARSGDAGDQLGFAQVAFAQYDFGWVCLRGAGIKVRGLANATADRRLYTTTTAGKLGTTSSGVLIMGVVFVSAVTTTGTSANAIANNPLSRMAISLSS